MKTIEPDEREQADAGWRRTEGEAPVAREPEPVAREPIGERFGERPERMRAFTHEARESFQHYREAPGHNAGALSGVLGIASAVLAILGLVGIWPHYMGPVAVIGIGLALLTGAGAFVSGPSPVGGRSSAEVLGGVAGIVMGVLVLANFSPNALMAIAPIVLGASLAAGAGPSYAYPQQPFGRRDEFVHAAATGGFGVQMLLGLGAAVLGLLALLGFAPGKLEFVALLALGIGVLLSTWTPTRVLARHATP